MSKKSEALLAMLDSELVEAYASKPSRARRGTADSAEKAQARELVTQRKADEAMAALRARDEATEREYAERFGKLAELGKRATALKFDMATSRKIVGYEKADGTIVKPARGYTLARRADEAVVLAKLEADMANVKLEQSLLFAAPIHPADLDPDTGRFIRSARYYVAPTGHRGRQVGMLAIDEADTVAQAVVLCYEDGEKSLAEAPLGWTLGKTVMLPTIGAMYRNMKKAHHLNLDRFRQAKRGLVAIMATELGQAGEHMVYVDSADMQLTALLAVGDLVTPDREALNRAARREAEQAARIMEARLQAASKAEGDAVAINAIKRLAAGQTIPEVAAKLKLSQIGVQRLVKQATVRSSDFYRNREAASVLGWAVA